LFELENVLGLINRDSIEVFAKAFNIEAYQKAHKSKILNKIKALEAKYSKSFFKAHLSNIFWVGRLLLLTTPTLFSIRVGVAFRGSFAILKSFLVLKSFSTLKSFSNPEELFKP
jgi:hypothetical protein